jgi:hypothetical protein
MAAQRRYKGPGAEFHREMKKLVDAFMAPPPPKKRRRRRR